MLCPKCNSTTYIPRQRCDRCGYEEPDTHSSVESSTSRAGKRKVVKFSDNLCFEFARQETDRPPAVDWKKELRQKLAEAQEKKGRRPSARFLEEKSPPAGTPSSPPKPPDIKRTAVDPQPISKASYDIHKNLLDFQASIQKFPYEKNSGSTASAAKKSLLQGEPPKLPIPPRAASPSAASPRAAAVRTRAETEPESQSWIVGKEILLTRTLSGLIDLLIVAGCAGLFLGISLRFGNIDVLSASFRPAFWGSILFFQLFYSVYFLGLTHRTVGMMLTGLKVIDEQAGELFFHQLLLRSLFFVFSWAMAVLGLLWALWDRRSRCMHDLLSRTTVIRC